MTGISTDIDLLHQDADILVVVKPAGLLSVPGRLPENHHSLTTRLEDQYGEIHVAHRLDMDTSGVMVFARNKPALRSLHRQFSERRVQKLYLAKLEGQLHAEAGVVDQPLICDWPNRPLQKICHEAGKPAQTHWRRLRLDANTTDVALTPITGRSHQLRVHMQSLGHPICGDRFYSAPQHHLTWPRMHLHAAMLGFEHPTSEAWLRFCPPFGWD